MRPTPIQSAAIPAALAGRDRFGAGFGGKGFSRTALGLETDGFGLTAELLAVGGGDDRDLDGIGAYVDDGDDGHVQKRNWPLSPPNRWRPSCVSNSLVRAAQK